MTGGRGHIDCSVLAWARLNSASASRCFCSSSTIFPRAEATAASVVSTPAASSWLLGRTRRKKMHFSHTAIETTSFTSGPIRASYYLRIAVFCSLRSPRKRAELCMNGCKDRCNPRPECLLLPVKGFVCVKDLLRSFERPRCSVFRLLCLLEPLLKISGQRRHVLRAIESQVLRHLFTR